MSAKRGRDAAAVGDEAAGRARAQLAVPRLVAVEHVVEHGRCRAVSVMNSVRNPISPRAGTRYSMRTQPVPWFTICSIRPLRSASIWVTTPR